MARPLAGCGRTGVRRARLVPLVLPATLLLPVAGFEPLAEACRCKPDETDGLTGCCLTEDFFLGLCFQKCSTLTQGRYPYRTASNTCCNSPSIADCLQWDNSDTAGWGCFGYGVGSGGECPGFPCLHAAPKTLHYSDDSVVGRWAFNLNFELPSAAEWGPMADVDGGHCTHLVVGNMEATDFTYGDVPEVGYLISGIHLECMLSTGEGTLTVNFGFTNSSIYLRLAVAPEFFEHVGVALPLGQVNILDCQVQARVGYLDFGGSSIMWQNLMHYRHDIIEAVDKSAGNLACDRMKPLVAQHAAEALASLAADLRQHLLPPQETNALLTQRDTRGVPSIEWDQYPPVRFLQALVEEKRTASTEVAKRVPVFNVTVNHTIASTSGDLTGSITIESIRVKGFDSLVPESLRISGLGERLTFSMEFRRMEVIVLSTVQLQSGRGRNGMAFSGPPLKKDVELAMELGDFSINVSLLAFVSEVGLDMLGVDQLQQVACLASCAQIGALPLGAPIQLTSVSFNTSAVPKLKLAMNGSVEEIFAETIDTTITAFLKGYLQSAENLVPLSISSLQPKITMAMDDFFDDMPLCRPTSVYSGAPAYVTYLMLFCAALLLLSALPLVAQWVWDLKVPECIRDGSMVFLPTEVHGHDQAYDQQDDDDDKGQEGDVPLFWHPVVPAPARFLCMNLLAAAAFLFLYADVGLGTVINVVIYAGGRSTVVGPVFAFSIGTCVRDALFSGAYLFAFVVAALSGVWPMTKLGLMLLCWLAPPSRLSLDSREKLLKFLDEYGKYSLIDSWISILALESYKLQWQSRRGDVSMMFDAVPKLPFFAFVFASVVSLVMGHLTSFFAVEAKEMDRGIDHTVRGQWTRQSLFCQLSRPQGAALVFGLLFTAVAVFAGAFVESISIVTSGVFSAAILDTSSRYYSLVALGNAVTKGAVTHAGSQMVQWIFFFFTMAVPLLLVVVLLFLWLVPMSLVRQRHLILFCECLDAWAAFDVYVLAVVVCWWQFGTMAKFLVYHDNIAVLCGWVRKNLDSECFQMECELAPGFAILAVGGIASYFVPKIAFQYSKDAVASREKALELGASRLRNDSVGSHRSAGSDSEGTHSSAYYSLYNSVESRMLESHEDSKGSRTSETSSCLATARGMNPGV